jgi:hypothetical protein
VEISGNLGVALALKAASLLAYTSR